METSVSKESLEVLRPTSKTSLKGWKLGNKLPYWQAIRPQKLP